MPFKSDRQKRWMYANKPEMAKEWSAKEGEENFNDAVERVIQQTERTKVDPSNPEVHVPGLGVWTVNTLKESLVNHIEEVGQRGDASKSQHNVIRAKLDTLLKAEEEMSNLTWKGKVTKHRRTNDRSKDI